MSASHQPLLLPHHIEYLVVDRDLTILEISSGVAQFAEKSDEVEIGRDVRLGFPELIGTEDVIEDIYLGKRDSFDLKTITRSARDGSPLYIDVYMKANRADRAATESLVIFFESVTDKMMLEQILVQSNNETQILLGALATSRDYIDKIIDSMADALIVTNARGEIKRINQAAQELFGYDETALINQPIALIITDQEILHQVSQSACLSQVELCKNLETAYLTKTGGNLTISFSCAAVGVERDLIYIARDISDRKREEDLLLESESRYRVLFEGAIGLMFEHASDLIQWSDTNGRIIYANRAWKEALGYVEAEIATVSLYETIHPDCQSTFRQIVEHVLAGEKLDRVDTELINKSGEKIWVEGNVSCKFTETGAPVSILSVFRDVTARITAEAALRHQQAQAERLLLNVLPESIAAQLKQLSSELQPSNNAIAESFADVTVLFADIVGFTKIATTLSPIALVNLLNQIFSAFDRLTETHSLEKIKTIGDAYMVVGGMPILRDDHVTAIAEMALDMQAAIAQFNHENHQTFKIRIGIHTGSVIAGVIGIKKFIYDLWGDTVNIASRMESHGIAGQIQVSAVTYERLRSQYQFQERGMIQVKDKGEMATYLLLGRREDNSASICTDHETQL
jgi:adenylate cyclase